MYIIITKKENFADYAQRFGCEVFRNEEVTLVESGMDELDIDMFLTSFLGRLAIDPDILGYDYLKYVLRRCIEEEEYYKKAMTRVIYPECAKHFGTTSYRVERAMRHAIEGSFEEVPEQYTKIYNRELKESPAPSKFIAVMANYITYI